MVIDCCLVLDYYLRERLGVGLPLPLLPLELRGAIMCLVMKKRPEERREER